ncbi:Na(+)-translocating NADH-quinone reductase subunit A [Pelagibaculum spongiae]|uniref:Na(+)-translocating NADH-quinone reductase subunit A n=1 Tax=Pelagibaculum spongiae TaxID=2080658 RepID=A0A2V1GYM4_9GAMM|nr:Na(+)-translocating NADH-quinone reductase subunit A [Pelagibaculum spongiae]PVZ69745.1 NADH:ubiquinone reductase (Na(+)-transporting) subunit A [Pelagibaculum spongiae]
MHKISKGLDLPISGKPDFNQTTSLNVKSVALLGEDYFGLRPTMLVQVGDQVKLGQPLFSDKKNLGVIFTAPGAGKVTAINRGARRALQSVVIELQGDEAESFESWSVDQLATIEREKVQQNLINSGLWTSLRTRPYSKVPSPESKASAIFINAMDTNPLAADPAQVLAERAEDFARGVTVLSRLTEGKVFVCHEASQKLSVSGSNVSVEAFSGPHPAGLSGTHIHTLQPASKERPVWSVNYQDVIAIGHLFVTGKLDTSRLISLAGPMVKKPGLVKTRIGASIEEITAGALQAGDVRVISGSVLAGAKAHGPLAYLGRYDLQISVIEEGYKQEFMGWAVPGTKKFSMTNTFVSALKRKGLSLPFTSSFNGSKRAMVPIGVYEKVMPLDLLPTQLLRALAVGDMENAEALGALELAEEDLGLCTYVCPGKFDFGPILRANLTQIEKES